jgi:hypothetical protein
METPSLDSWRSLLPYFPAPTRKRWGELANQFEAEGVAFPESEYRAFEIIRDGIRRWEQDNPLKPIPYESPRDEDLNPIDLELFDYYSTLPYRSPPPIKIPATLPIPVVRAIQETQAKLDKLREAKESKSKPVRKRKSKHDSRVREMF